MSIGSCFAGSLSDNTSSKPIPVRFSEEFIKHLTVIATEICTISSLQPTLFTKFIPTNPQFPLKHPFLVLNHFLPTPCFMP